MRLNCHTLAGCFGACTLLILVMLSTSCQTLALNAFRLTDPERTTLINSALQIENYRTVPANAVTGGRSLTLVDCRRLALDRNLDLLVAQIEEQTKAAIRDGNQKKILPHLMFTGQLSERDNYSYSFSDIMGQEGLTPNPALIGTSAGVNTYAVSSERNSWLYSLELRWGFTDAALAYYLTKSSTNDQFRARYQRIRVAQKLMGIVEATFHRLLSLQERLPKVRRLVRLRNNILKEAAHLFKQLVEPVDFYQRARQDSLRAARLLVAVEEEIQQQRSALASAMALSPDRGDGRGFQVYGRLSSPRSQNSIPTLEMIAIRNRPESYEAGLKYLSSTNDFRRAIVKCFPKLTGFWRFSRDKNRYLYNKDWKDVGLRVQFDLGEWLSNWDETRAARSQRARSEQEMGVVALGIVSQVRQAALKYSRSLRDLENARLSLDTARTMLSITRTKSSANDITQLKLLDAEADTLEDHIAWLGSLGEANAKLAELRAAMGTNYSE